MVALQDLESEGSFAGEVEKLRFEKCALRDK